MLTTLVWAAALFAAPTAALAQADGPVAAYAFSESSGVVATDSSSAGNSPASLQGASHVPGRFGSGLQLDGLDDAVQLPLLDTLTLTNAFTVEGWISPSAFGRDRSVWWTPTAMLTLRAEGTLVPVAILTGGQVGFISTPILRLDTWVHVAVTYDGSMLRLFVDGVDAGSRPATGTLVPSLPEAALFGGASGYAGKMDELRIYRRALSEAEIRFDATTPLDFTLPLDVSKRTPDQDAVGVTQTTVGAVFTRALDARTITASTFELRDAQNLVTPASVAYDPATRQATLSPASALAPLAQYTARVIGGSLGVRDAAGLPLAADVVWTFRTAASATTASAIYHFTEASAVTVADASGNGNDAALVNGAASGAGRIGNGLRLDGVDDTVQLPLTQTLSLSSAYTFEAWIAPSALGRDRLVWWTPTTMLTLRGDGTFVPVAILTAGQVGFVTEASVPLDTWSHVAMTYDGSLLRLYINGAEVGSRPASGTLVPWTPPEGGRLGGELGFAGTIDDVRIYRRALNAGEIAADMTVPVAPPVATPFVVTAVAPADLGVYVAGSKITATFNRAVAVASVTSASVQLRDGTNQIVAASVGYDAATFTVTLTPASPLAASATYSVRIAGGANGIQAEGTGQLSADVQWSFRTPAPIPPPSSVAPHINSVDIVSTWLGQGMLVLGSNFGQRQSTSTVTVNGTPAAVVAWCNDAIIAVLPRGVTAGPVVVKVDGTSSNAVTAQVYTWRR